MADESVSATTVIDAPAQAIFAVLADPANHAAIDGRCGAQPLDRSPYDAPDREQHESAVAERLSCEALAAGGLRPDAAPPARQGASGGAANRFGPRNTPQGAKSTATQLAVPPIRIRRGGEQKDFPLVLAAIRPRQ